MDLAYIEIIDTNKELHKELGKEISINKDSEKKIRSLIKEVETCYRSLTHQDSTIIAHEEEIISLKAKISSLKKCLRQVEKDVKLKDEASTVQDSRIIELEDKVSQLKARIRELVSKKILAINEEDMAQPNPIDVILGCRQTIATCLQEIRAYMDWLPIYDDNGRQADIPNHIGRLFNNITDNLLRINGHADMAHWDIARYQGIINNGNAQVQDLRDELANARNRITILDISLDNERIEANRNLNDAQAALNNARVKCERVVEMLTRANGDERRARQQLQTELVNTQRERDDARRNAHCWTVRYNNDAAELQAARQRLQTNAQNQVNRMIANTVRKQARIGVLLREKFVFQLVIRQRDQNILILQQQILALQNNPPVNMAAAAIGLQHVMNAMAPLLSQISQYTG